MKNDLLKLVKQKLYDLYHKRDLINMDIRKQVEVIGLYVPEYMDIWKEAMSLFLDELPEDTLINDYLMEVELKDLDYAYDELIDHIAKYSKKELWFTTNVAIIEAVENMIEAAYRNGNIARPHSER